MLSFIIGILREAKRMPPDFYGSVVHATKQLYKEFRPSCHTPAIPDSLSKWVFMATFVEQS
jgi:hypothetical protein